MKDAIAEEGGGTTIFVSDRLLKTKSQLKCNFNAVTCGVEHAPAEVATKAVKTMFWTSPHKTAAQISAKYQLF